MKPIAPRIEAVKDFRVTLIVVVLVYIAVLITVSGAANRREESSIETRLKHLEKAQWEQIEFNDTVIGALKPDQAKKK